jgi:sugar/nucleoside kinase (ribokinase family)
MKGPLTIAGAGCCLVDQIYTDIDFSHPQVRKYLSRHPGDGGLHPGKLVFAEQFRAFSGEDPGTALAQITGFRAKSILNVGGPSIVALIHAAQMLRGTSAEVRYYGTRGNDSVGEFLQSSLEKTPVKLEQFLIIPGSTPTTIVLSDPSYHHGHGERAFINHIGAAMNMDPDRLDSSFFEADVVVFGGTALVPNLHARLTSLLRKCRSAGCITVVNTVYDFMSELKNPGKKWTIGERDDAWPLIDLLVTDREEALHLSGASELKRAGAYFHKRGVSAFLITCGTEPTVAYSDGRIFEPVPMQSFPVSSDLITDLKGCTGGDTTGCGDNFVGGVLASLLWQMQKDRLRPDLLDCLAWGTVSGGFCCFHPGGTYLEEDPGEKLGKITPYYHRYIRQIHD